MVEHLSNNQLEGPPPDEIEFKVLEIDQEDVSKKLEAIGAEKTFDGEIRDIFLDTENRRLRSLGYRLKMRTTIFRNLETGEMEEELEVTLKGPKEIVLGIPKRLEIGVTVPDKEAALITALIWIKLYVDPDFEDELEEKYKIRKNRVSYKIDDISFDMDEYLEDEEDGIKKDLSHIPILLEVEMEKPEYIQRAVEITEKELELIIDKEQSHFSTGKVITHYQ